jgi:hypothetical protein
MICLLYVQIEVTTSLQFNLKFILYESLITPLNDCCVNDWGCPLWRHSTIFECGASSDYAVIVFRNASICLISRKIAPIKMSY